MSCIGKHNLDKSNGDNVSDTDAFNNGYVPGLTPVTQLIASWNTAKPASFGNPSTLSTTDPPLREVDTATFAAEVEAAPAPGNLRVILEVQSMASTREGSNAQGGQTSAGGSRTTVLGSASEDEKLRCIRSMPSGSAHLHGSDFLRS